MDWLQVLQNAGLPVLTAVEVMTEDGPRINATFSGPLTPQQVVLFLSLTDPGKLRKINAKTNAANIPNWATWTESQALDWLVTNIGTPLTQPIPANPMTVQQIRAVLVNIVAIVEKQYQTQQAMARMIIALRDDTWPNF